VCVFELDAGAQLLCVFVVFFYVYITLPTFRVCAGLAFGVFLGWAAVEVVVGCSGVFPGGRNGRAMSPVVPLF